MLLQNQRFLVLPIIHILGELVQIGKSSRALFSSQMLFDAMSRKLAAHPQRRPASPAISSGQRATPLTQRTQAVASSGPGCFTGLQTARLLTQVSKHVLYIIGFPERYTVMAQDVVSRDQVKVELWSSPVHSVFAAGHIEGHAIW